MADDEQHELRRLDLRTPVGAPLVGVVPSGEIGMNLVDGMLWVSRGADDTVLRIQPAP